MDDKPLANRSFRDARTVKMSEALDTFLAGSDNLMKSRELLAALVWDEVVGEWYAQHTEVIRVDHGVCTVHCDSAPRAQQLQLDAPEVIDRLNSRLGGRFIHQIRATSGGIRRESEYALPQAESVPPATLAEIENWPLLPSDEQQIARMAAEVADEELRARFERVLHRAYRLAGWQRAHGWRPCEQCGRLTEPGRRACLACNPGRIPSQGSDEQVYDNDWGKSQDKTAGRGRAQRRR